MRLPLALAPLLLLCTAAASADYGSHPKAATLLERLRQEHGFSAAELDSVRAALSEAQRLPQLVEMEQKAPERTETWTRYSSRIDQSRIDGGVAVLRDGWTWASSASSPRN